MWVEPCSIDAAAAVAPDGAIGAAGTGPHHDHRRTHNTRCDNHGAAIGLASTIGATMPAGAASARGVRGAEAGESAGDQNCCE